jgi:Flp pilus assembly protein TadG
MRIFLLWRNISYFKKSTAGSIAVIVALALIPIIIGSGAAVDFGRAYMVQSRLSYALDAAGLAVGSSDPSSDLNSVLTRYFAANYPEEQLGTPATPAMVITDGVIQLTATASVRTLFLGLININQLTVEASSRIVRDNRGLEIVLVLDNTGSMAQNGKIEALRIAAQDMVNILFRNDENPENLTMGLVPFVTTVNIGQNSDRFVRDPTPPHNYPNTIDTAWKGCVEARPFPNDTNDDFIPGNSERGEWNPYYWEAEDIFTFSRNQNGNPGRPVFFSACENSWWRPFEFPNTFQDIPRGSSGSVPFEGVTRGGFDGIDVIPERTQGPNKACPDQVIPLTNDRSDLEAGIARMKPWPANGTMANIGAVWGWRLLSPTPPFVEGLPYEDARNNKVLVILTDGVNIFSGNSRSCRNTNPKYTSQYTAYDYLGEGRLGTTNSNTARIRLNERLETTCENIKETGITIFTIVFQLADPTILDLFRECASGPERFFNSPNNDTLRSAFRAIGAELSNLRIAQ